MEYMQGKINELKTDGMKRNIGSVYRGINEFKKCQKPRGKLVQDKKGNLLADFHSVMNGWKKCFCQLLNEH